MSAKKKSRTTYKPTLRSSVSWVLTIGLGVGKDRFYPGNEQCEQSGRDSSSPCATIASFTASSSELDKVCSFAARQPCIWPISTPPTTGPSQRFCDTAYHLVQDVQRSDGLLFMGYAWLAYVTNKSPSLFLLTGCASSLPFCFPPFISSLPSFPAPIDQKASTHSMWPNNQPLLSPCHFILPSLIKCDTVLMATTRLPHDSFSPITPLQFFSNHDQHHNSSSSQLRHPSSTRPLTWLFTTLENLSSKAVAPL